MRTRRNDIVQIVILVVLGVGTVLSLLIPQVLGDPQPPSWLSLSVLLRDSESAGWATARQGMEQAADELGAELRFLTLTSPNDGEEQAASLRREVEEGANALVVVPADPSSLARTLDQLPSHCPVVSLESAGAGFAGMVAPDNTLLGRELALALAEDWDGGTVLLLDTGDKATGISDRLKAARTALEERQIPAEVRSALPEEGALYPWVMAFEPTATRQAADRNSGGEEAFSLYGVGSTTAIIAHLERGDISALGAWNDYAAGYLAVKQAVEAVQGLGQEPVSVPFSILRGEDIYEPENQKLLFPVTS